MSEDTHNWQPLSVEQVAELLSGLTVPWWVTGGWAIDLFAGCQTRPHEDTDVLIRRGDQLDVQEYLSAWDLHKTQQPGLKPWPTGEFLGLGVNDVWCRPDSDSPWSLQFMLLDTQDDCWIFRRDPAIHGPLSTIGLRTQSGIPYLAPEIQLLYKAKPETLDKDQADFKTALPLMSERACNWLLRCMHRRFPDGHDWTRALRQRVARHLDRGEAATRAPHLRR